MGQIIDERGEGLDAAVTLAEYNLDITKKINSNIKEQRTDLVAIDNNAGEALDNALEAEKNIEEAQEHQKATPCCPCAIF